MKKYLKNINLKFKWLLVLVGILGLMILGYSLWTAQNINKDISFEKKLKCYELGDDLYERFGNEYGYDNMGHPEYKYNPTLDTCLYANSHSLIGGEMYQEVVIDVLTRRELAEYLWYSDLDSETAKNRKQSFKELKNIYMSGGSIR